MPKFIGVIGDRTAPDMLQAISDLVNHSWQTELNGGKPLNLSGTISLLTTIILNFKCESVSREEVEAVANIAGEVPSTLVPFIEAEIDRNPALRGITVKEFLARDGENPSLLQVTIENARKAERNAVLPILTPVKPGTHIMPNNSLANKLFSDNPAVFEGAFDLTVMNKRGKAPDVTAYTICKFEGSKDLHIYGGTLTEFDRAVSDAVISIWAETQKQGVPCCFSVVTVYKAMPGTADGNPSPQQRGAITKSLNKLRGLTIEVDVSEEFARRGNIEKGEICTISGNYFVLYQETRKTLNGGEPVSAYVLTSIPLLYNYCLQTGQLLSASPAYLTPKKIDRHGRLTSVPLVMSMERTMLLNYLIRRIKTIQHDRKNKKRHLSDRILFSTIFRAAGLENIDKFKRKDCRDFVFDVLEYYTKMHFISGYKPVMKGQIYVGIDILQEEKKPGK